MDDPGGYLMFSSLSPAPADPMESVIGAAFVIILLVFSGIISATEIAFFSIKPELLGDVPESPSKNKLVWLLDRSKALLATILLLSNMLNIGVVMFFDGLIGTINFGNISPWAHFLIEVVAVTFIIIVFGEIIPKVYARKFGLSISLLFSLPMSIMVHILKPFTWPLTQFSSLIDRRVKSKGTGFSVENLSDAIEMTSAQENDEGDHKILKGIAHFGSINVTSIMTPRNNSIMVDWNCSFDELKQIILENGYSRMPIYKGKQDEIVGILFIKDIIEHIYSSADFTWQKLVREPFFIPENKKIDDLLREFQIKKVHMALVMDEFGGFKGVVTLEDIIEEIVGEINDEYDEEDVDYYKMNDSNYIFAAKTSLHDLARIINIDLNFFEELGNEIESIAGVVLELCGKIPSKNETVAYKNLTFKIMNADNRRINRVKISIMPDSVTPESTSLSGGIISPLLILLFISSFLFSCGGSDSGLVPRPKGYARVELPKKEYRNYDSICPFTFEYPVYAKIQPYRRDLTKTCWFDIVFPQYAATLYLSYENVKGNFTQHSEDQHELVYKHTTKANAIEEIFIDAPGDKVWGIVYDIEGDVASNYQFHVTDSHTHFLRGSLYFDFKANNDSVEPVLKFLKKDVMHLVETVKWK